MLDSDIHALFDVPVADSLVDYDAHGGLRYVVDDAGFAVVDFVGHAFLDGAVGFDVDDITDSVHWLVWISGIDIWEGKQTCIDVNT